MDNTKKRIFANWRFCNALSSALHSIKTTRRKLYIHLQKVLKYLFSLRDAPDHGVSGAPKHGIDLTTKEELVKKHTLKALRADLRLRPLGVSCTELFGQADLTVPDHVKQRLRSSYLQLVNDVEFAASI